ncbi:dTDP-4-dehydrorhamnose reductase [Candidatus Borrarchaeum sp.]|uniref:dTDP-4-dehydrorhamnose reductase n=1 Tax=Candidatus Borrarchaeum sp. TaxID=2846742 RepID=UPI00258086C9|nr:dTDP-4-dehydrorhamnose reductase [Candidatus Borrarchaeum sp.]
MKVAVIGAKGQLGSDLVKVFDADEVISLTHEEIEVEHLDSCKIFKKSTPDVIVNTAAFHKTDACEDNPEKTFLVNTIGAKNVAETCSELDAILIYISTDYVFDGNKGVPYNEYDTPNPINTYGISKLAGEFYTKLAEKYYVVRVASLFGVAGASGKGGNFVETMISKARSGQEIKVVDDIVMSPTYTKEAAIMVKNIVKNALPFGEYHVTNDGYCSWYEFAKTIFELLGTDVVLQPIKARSLNLKAKRPAFSALETVKLRKHALEMDTWKEALKKYLKEKGQIY